MAIQRSSDLIHWNYFLAIEEDLHRLGRFVDFSGNDNTYSVEIARLLLTACAEVDSVLKGICRAAYHSSSAGSISQYFPEVMGAHPNFTSFEATIPQFGLTLRPWIDWSQVQSPQWWQDHNKVKHQRDANFEKANFKNCINATAALYIATLHLYKKEAELGELRQLPLLFNVADVHFGGTGMGRYGHSFTYKL